MKTFIKLAFFALAATFKIGAMELEENHAPETLNQLKIAVATGRVDIVKQLLDMERTIITDSLLAATVITREAYDLASNNPEIKILLDAHIAALQNSPSVKNSVKKSLDALVPKEKEAKQAVFVDAAEGLSGDVSTPVPTSRPDDILAKEAQEKLAFSPSPEFKKPAPRTPQKTSWVKWGAVGAGGITLGFIANYIIDYFKTKKKVETPKNKKVTFAQ